MHYFVLLRTPYSINKRKGTLVRLQSIPVPDNVDLIYYSYSQVRRPDHICFKVVGAVANIELIIFISLFFMWMLM
jgi:hypothetical protein